jgi:phosphoglycerol transferase
VATTPDYALVRLPGAFRPIGALHLSQPYGGLVSGAEGLSVAEPWGRWSTGKHVVLHFDRPLPKVADVLLKAQAYADNTTLPFSLRVGGESIPFRLGPSLQEIKLRMHTDGKQRSLSIEVPRPTSPRSLGQWADDRALGIGIAEVSIGQGD